MTSFYRNLTFKFVILIVLIFVLDQSLGYLLRKFYFKQLSGLQYRTTYSIEKTKADILFFGSSRSNHHYNPAIFEDSLKLSAYNVGRDGNGLPYHYAILQSILSRYTPKIVVLDLLKDDFQEDHQAYDRLASLLPYYKTHPEIRDVINMRSHFEKIKLLSAIYPYNSSLVTIAAGNVKIKGRTEDLKGYLPLHKVWSTPKHPVKPAIRTVKIDERKVNLFKAFIATCQQRGVKLYVVVSPYLESSGQETTLTLARKIAKQNNIIFWDYSSYSLFRQSPSLFADPVHLNWEGATQYSSFIVGYIHRSLTLQTTSESRS